MKKIILLSVFSIVGGLVGCEAELNKDDLKEIKALRTEVVSLREELSKQNSISLTEEANKSKEIPYIPMHFAAPEFKTQEDKWFYNLVNEKGWRFIDVVKLDESRYRVKFTSSNQRVILEDEIDVQSFDIGHIKNTGMYQADLKFIVNQEDRSKERDVILYLYEKIKASTN